MNKDQWTQKMQSVARMQQQPTEAANGAIGTKSDPVPVERRRVTGDRRCATEDRRARPTETAPPIRPVEAHGTCCEWSLPNEGGQFMARHPYSS